MSCCVTNALQVEHIIEVPSVDTAVISNQKSMVMQSALEAQLSLATLSRPSHTALPQLC